MNLISVKHKRIVLASAALLVVIFVQPVAGQRQGSAPVTVTNTESNPVPVTGSVMVTNLPSQPQASHFQVSATCVLGEGQLATTCNVYVVPAGKQAVIEYFSIGLNNIGSTYDGNEYRPSLETTLGGSLVRHRLQPYTVEASIEPGGGQVVRLYADAGTTVNGRVATNLTIARSITLTISGTLVDAP